MIMAICPDLTPTHIILNRNTSPVDPQRTPHAHAPKVLAAIFLEPIFRKGTNALTLSGQPLTPPQCQTSPPPCARPSARVRHRDPFAPWSREPPLVTRKMPHFSTLSNTTIYHWSHKPCPKLPHFFPNKENDARRRQHLTWNKFRVSSEAIWAGIANRVVHAFNKVMTHTCAAVGAFRQSHSPSLIRTNLST